MYKKILVSLLVLSMLMTGCNTDLSESTDQQERPDSSAADTSSQEKEVPKETIGEMKYVTVSDIEYLARPSLLSNFAPSEMTVTSTVNWQTPANDLSNVYIGGFILDDEEIALLSRNGFVLSEGFMLNYEFYQQYESNRYANLANYITVDSMVHTYHLYFSHLLKKTEQNYLIHEMLNVSQQMMSAAAEQYLTLQGTEWEEAARMELAFFAVGTLLLDPDAGIPEIIAQQAAEELSAIYAAEKIDESVIFPKVIEDYTQYTPRGYYDSSEDLQRYFRAMMWYGRMGFRQDNETFNRAALLITLALNSSALEDWSHVYAITSFFAGASDDIGYYELKPLIDAVYGSDLTTENLIGREDLWTTFNQLCVELPAPAINSVPVYDDVSDEEQAAAQKGFRFMGQRFSIDESCFTQLVYRQIEPSESGTKRLLPDALDFPAALGSETALNILTQEGKTNYPNYAENMQKLRETTANADTASWTANLYSSWIYTLMPMLDEKNNAYPPFMRSDAWNRKSLMSFEGSYTELKHDTLLYSKQVMGEMGGGEIPEYDDRGFVEAEPVIFSRLQEMINLTMTGLSDYGMIDTSDKQSLSTLAELSGKLKTIAEKELSGELPTDEEFDLIRNFGGQLEHFWEDVMDAEFPEESWHSPEEHPAAVVADIATDPNGTCLEVGTGQPMEIRVIVEVDGRLKIASGSVFTFYQFEHPVSDRLTDTKWRQILGINPNDSGEKHKDTNIQCPDWYSDLIRFNPYVWY